MFLIVLVSLAKLLTLFFNIWINRKYGKTTLCSCFCFLSNFRLYFDTKILKLKKLYSIKLQKLYRNISYQGRRHGFESGGGGDKFTSEINIKTRGLGERCKFPKCRVEEKAWKFSILYLKVYTRKKPEIVINFNKRKTAF